MDDLESRLDDLLICQFLVREYAESKDCSNDDITSFSSQINKVFRKFRAAACSMNTNDEEEHIQACLESYRNALDGANDIGKFYRHWTKISATKVLCFFAFLKLVLRALSRGYHLCSPPRHLKKVMIITQSNGQTLKTHMYYRKNNIQILRRIMQIHG